MAKEYKKKRSENVQAIVGSQKATHRFTKGGTVAAAPVHRGAGIKPGDGNADALVKTLDNLTKLAIGESKNYIERKKEAGITAAARGEGKPDDFYGGKAYEVANGLASKSTYLNYMAQKEQELLRENPDISRRKFTAELRKHGNDFTSGKHDNFVIGLSDTLIEYEQTVGTKWDGHETYDTGRKRCSV